MRNISFLFIVSRGILQRYVEFNRLLWKIFLHVIPVRIIVPWIHQQNIQHLTVEIFQYILIVTPLIIRESFRKDFPNWKRWMGKLSVNKVKKINRKTKHKI